MTRITRRQFEALLSMTCVTLAVDAVSGHAVAQSSITPIELTSNELNALERRAGVDVPDGRSAPRLSSSNVYTVALPRLLAVADAAAQSGDTQLAADAARLLSNLNTREKTIPEFFRPLGRVAAPRFNDLKAEYRRLFQSCVPTDSRKNLVAWHVGRLTKHKDRYEAVANETRVPWYFIGIVHALEASFNFGGHLHNGDPLTAKTVNVPANRPEPWLPPSDWKSSAKDALQVEHFIGHADWSLEMMLYRWEQFNGFGYRRNGIKIATPYLWSFSNHYRSGKFVSDGRYNANAVSQQCGAAVILKALVNAAAVQL